MPVERLDALLDAAWSHRLGLVIAPAGSGKTTLLARFARRAGGPVGWYRAEGWDRDEETLVHHLEAALAPKLDGLTTGWSSVADAANALDAWTGGRVLLIVDDLHTLEGTDAEAALERLVEYAPPTLTILAASRVPPRFNLPRLRVSGALMEIGTADLRFRSWEVERLFRDFYQEPLPPEELARLARRTDGWAAGLQLFHLATRGRAPDERRRVLAALGPSSRLMRDYLTRNVLDQLSTELRRFLIETSVLGRLSGPLCDRLLGRSGSAELLAELERRGLFTQALTEDGVYRYHEVLRSYLQGVLLEEVGQSETREKLRRAGQLLAEADALPEALEAFFRAEDREQAQNLLARDGVHVADRSSAWIDALPPTVVMHDPWLLLASARRLRAEGRFEDAVGRYQSAEAAFAGTEPAGICRDERLALNGWLDPGWSLSRRDWPTVLRSALSKEPLHVSHEAMTLPAEGPVVSGLALLLAGHVGEAQRRLSSAAEDETHSVFGRTVAAMGAGIAAMLAGQAHAGHAIQGAVAAAEALGFDWLARLGRASLAIGGSEEAVKEALNVAAACDAAGDRWGSVLARFFAAWGGVAAHAEVGDLESLGTEFRALGAPVGEAWSHGLGALALARIGAPDTAEAATQAEALARSAGVPVARLLSYAALAECTPEGTDEYLEIAEAIRRETGISEPSLGLSGGARSSYVNGHAADGPAPLRIRLLAGFELTHDGERVDMSGVRPRVRSLLRLLSLNANAALHHEAIEAALWPDADGPVAARNLHVAVAALRRALEPRVARGGYQLIVREGDAYRFALPARGEVDLQQFEAAVDAGRSARERGDRESARLFLASALELYRGELLPEEGPAEWVVERREMCRLSAVDAAQALAELLLSGGDPQEAARVCAHGLRIERYHDPLWRLLILARDHAGDQGAASRARLGYDQMLAELGVEPAPAVSGGP
jgi:DNA-binding SARP family transcriptional activator